MSDLFISDAFAQNAAAAPSAGFSTLMPIILVFIVMYLLVIRPQQKKAKQHQELVNNLKIGNKVCTNSGIFGSVRAVNAEEGTIDLEIADNVVIKVLKFSVSEVVVKKDVAEKKAVNSNSKKAPAKKVAKADKKTKTQK
ncbi:MAG: preprotein translocase subunit YajC [Proteobacteria bacterium]|nr:preprotein translocase subunit YajC [Pseudomonadota bacterium]